MNVQSPEQSEDRPESLNTTIFFLGLSEGDPAWGGLSDVARRPRLWSHLPDLSLLRLRKRLRQLPPALHRSVQWLLRQEGSPGQRSRGLAAGVFAGCFPFFGLQTLLGVALASLLRGNRILAAAGTWISNPFTYVPLYWFNYTIGKRLLEEPDGFDALPGGAASSVPWNDVWSLGWTVARCVLLGSTLVGLALGTGLGLLCWLWLRRTRPAP